MIPINARQNGTDFLAASVKLGEALAVVNEALATVSSDVIHMRNYQHMTAPNAVMAQEIDAEAIRAEATEIRTRLFMLGRAIQNAAG